MLEDEILTLNDIDNLSPLEFEEKTAIILTKIGYNARVTKASGDFGADVIAEKDGITYAIQCKLYSNKVNLEAIQQVNSAKNHYNCNLGIVLTNNYFNQSAKELAKTTNTILWDRDFLKELIEKFNYKLDNDEDDISVLLEDLYKYDDELKYDIYSILKIDNKEYVIVLPTKQEKLLIYEKININENKFKLINIKNNYEIEEIKNIYYGKLNSVNMEFLGEKNYIKANELIDNNKDIHKIKTHTLKEDTYTKYNDITNQGFLNYDIKDKQLNKNKYLDNTNKDIIINKNFKNKRNNKWCALLLLLFFGLFGIHKFYEEKIPQGVLYILILYTPLSPLLLILCVKDFIIILKQKNPYYT